MPLYFFKTTQIMRSKDLIAMGYPDTKVISIALNIMEKKPFKFLSEDEQKVLLLEIQAEPEKFMGRENLSKIAACFQEAKVQNKEIKLTEGLDYAVFGRKHIDQGAFNQMDVAVRLPITVAGALMPDAHHGYGLPIGGVLATENAIVPYAVGVDIGCRMCLSVFPRETDFLSKKERFYLKNILNENTRFGEDVFRDNNRDDDFFDRSELNEIAFVKNLKDKAYTQIGSSGGGNHFVEWGEVEITEQDAVLGLQPGKYLALLSHSGSRGFGAMIAGQYTKIAMSKCLLPPNAKNLAWLSMDSQEGQEYWLAMNLAGDYASACHHHIHRRISKAIGFESLQTVENHHNFAWKETYKDGREVFVHRKGATPAQKDVLGIIPGSMTSPAFIVKGKGNEESLHSASHGAGRVMSRSKALTSFTKKMLNDHLYQSGVELIQGSIDESPFVYKDIHQVIKEQTALIDVLGVFNPKIVKMEM